MPNVTLQHLVQNWYDIYDNTTVKEGPNFPATINNIFPYIADGGQEKLGKTFCLPKKQLSALLNIESSIPNNQLRLHLAATRSVTANPAIGSNAPSFLLILDAYHLRSGEDHPSFHRLFDNAVAMTFNHSAVPLQNTPPEPKGISKEEAKEMIDAFEDIYKNGSQFSTIIMGDNPAIQPPSRAKRIVYGFTVESDDVNMIVQHLQEGDDTDLYIHLGSLPTKDILPEDDWFRFRCVLQINGTTDGEAFYYDFAKPCPPACGGGFDEPSLKNTLNH